MALWRTAWEKQGGPCGEATCNVCNICTHGFKLDANVGQTARHTNFDLRYGEGLYFSSVSGKANDYAGDSEKVRWVDGARVHVGACAFRTRACANKVIKETSGRNRRAAFAIWIPTKQHVVYT